MKELARNIFLLIIVSSLFACVTVPLNKITDDYKLTNKTVKLSSTLFGVPLRLRYIFQNTSLGQYTSVTGTQFRLNMCDIRKIY